jgi:hypothetical protein
MPHSYQYLDKAFWLLVCRTVYSVLNRSPPELVEEIILVDDASTLPHLGDRLTQAGNYGSLFCHKGGIYESLDVRLCYLRKLKTVLPFTRGVLITVVKKMWVLNEKILVTRIQLKLFG